MSKSVKSFTKAAVSVIGGGLIFFLLACAFACFGYALSGGTPTTVFSWLGGMAGCATAAAAVFGVLVWTDGI